MDEKRLKKKLLLLDLCLAAGFIAYALILFSMNRSLGWEEIGGSRELIERRFSGWKTAEVICGICSMVHCIGHLIYLRELVNIPFRKMSCYFLAQFALMYLCVLPFALFDRGYFGDYFYPIWGIAIRLLLVYAIYAFLRGYRRYKKGRES